MTPSHSPNELFPVGTTLVSYKDMQESLQVDDSRIQCSFNVGSMFVILFVSPFHSHYSLGFVFLDLIPHSWCQVTVLEGINVLVTSVGHSFLQADAYGPSLSTDYLIDSANMFGKSGRSYAATQCI